MPMAKELQLKSSKVINLKHYDPDDSLYYQKRLTPQSCACLSWQRIRMANQLKVPAGFTNGHLKL